MRLSARLLAMLALGWSLPLLAESTPEYDLHYHITLDPDSDSAEVSIELDHDGLVRELDFNIDPDRHYNIEANGKLRLENGRARWEPPREDARLTLTARISHKRDNDTYDALMTEDWAIFRGDDLVPPARSTTRPGAESRARLTFSLPAHWSSVTTGWDRLDAREFSVENPERRFSRPTGWMIAGRLGTRREKIGDSDIAVSAPRGSDLRRLDVITFVTMIWPELESAFGDMPPKLAIIGHGDPMWRGGLSAPNSLFLHARRPMVSENGTSALIHELMHVVTGIRGTEGHDWIIEGLAEFYSFELLYRAGAMTESRRRRVLEGLEDWGAESESLIKDPSSGANTARAVVLFEAVDRELREHSDGELNLDDIVRELITLREVSLDDLRRISSELAGAPLDALDDPVLETKDS